MPYVTRDVAGVIIALNQAPNDQTTEWLDVNDQEIIAYNQRHQIHQHQQAKQALSASDAEMIRVIEDVIDLLIAKQVFIYTELPDAVQQKLGMRRSLRQTLNELSNLIKDDPGIF